MADDVHKYVMPCDVALRKLKAVRARKLCIEHKICPQCGGELEVVKYWEEEQVSMKCEDCKTMYNN